MGGARRSTELATIGAMLLSLAPLAHGQSAADVGDPLVVTPRLELESLHLEDFEAALELEWRRDVDENDPPVGRRNRTDEDRLREILELRTSGFIGHPNLIELDLGGRVWLEQRWLDLDAGSTQNDDQTLYEWDVSARFFRDTRIPFTIYTRQNISDIDRDFGATLENTFRESGVRLSLRDDVLPTNIQFFRREIKQEDRGQGEDFDIDQDTIMADGRVEMGPQQDIAWDIKYDDIDESGNLRLARAAERFEGNATHTINFGEDDANVLRTRVRYFDETGDRDLRQLRVDPRLRLRHSQDFHTWYDYSYGRDERPDQDQRTQRASANFQHELFDSVTTIGNVGYDQFEITTEDFDREEVFGRIDTEYRKEVPYGQLRLGFDAVISREDQSKRGASVSVSDELYIFNAANRIVILRRNVDPTSIVITDVAGIFVYTEGSDYFVRAFPDRVEIDRIVGGNIAAGQAVLVDYVIGPEPGGTTDTLGTGVDFRYSFGPGPLEGLSLYVQYRHQDERRDLRSDDFPENDFDDTRYGVEYNFGKVYLRAEGEHRTGALSPFDAVRFEGRYVEPLGRGNNIVLSGLYQEIDRTIENLTTRTTTLTGQWNQRIGDQLRLALIIRYQWSDDNQNFDSEAFEQQFDLVWRRGQTEMYAQIRNTETDTNANDTTLQRFIVGVRREF